MKMNCLIVDDEPAGRKIIEDYVRNTDFLQLIGSVSSPAKAIPLINDNDIQLLFLDVQMPKMSGLELLRSLEDPPMAIMVSAHSEYALQGFELDVMDYLLKPVSAERFQKAVNKAREFMELKKLTGTARSEATHFFIKCDKQYERIRFDELLFVEASNNNVVLQTIDKRFTTYLTFKAVSDYLPPDKFMKIHKSFLVATDKIESIDGEKMKIGSYDVPISRGMRNEVLDRVLNKNVIKR
jgi:DNA-binding LytR/AlgR family response regulator